MDNLEISLTRNMRIRVDNFGKIFFIFFVGSRNMMYESSMWIFIASFKYWTDGRKE